MRLKLFIDKQGKKVIFAEANNDDFVDFLARMLSFWLACVPKLEPQLTGSLANLYSSFEHDLHEFYRQQNRVSRICPKLYKCTKSRCSFVSDDETMHCPKHSCVMSQGLDYVSRAPVDKSTVTYIVTDDLKVECGPGTSTVMELFRKYGVKDFASVEEKVVHLSEDEALKMLEASRNSQTVLTDVFLKKITEERSDGAVLQFAQYWSAHYGSS